MKKIKNKIVPLLFILTIVINNTALSQFSNCEDPNSGTISSGIHNKYCSGTQTNNSSGVLYTDDANVNYISATKISLLPGFSSGLFNNDARFNASVSELTILTSANTNGKYDKYEKIEIEINVPDFNVVRKDYNSSWNYIGNKTVNINQDIEAFFNSSTYPNPHTNPYDQYDIDVEVTFTNATESETYTTWGFYYREFEYDVINPDVTNLPENWNEIPESEGWRVRFAPPKDGVYQVSSKVTCYGQVVYEITYEDQFIVETPVSNANPGCLKFDSGKKYMSFSETDKTFVPVGYGNMTANLDGNYCAYYPAEYYFNRLYLTNLIGRGNYIRTSHDLNFFVEHDQPLNYDSHQNTMWEFDKFLEIAEDNDIYISYILNTWETFWECENGDQFHYDDDDNNGTRAHFNIHPYRDSVQIGDDELIHEGNILRNVYSLSQTPVKDFFDNSDARILYKNRLRYIISRWGYSNNIAVMDLWAEMENTIEKKFEWNNVEKKCLKDNQQLHVAGIDVSMYLWLSEMASYLKSIKPKQLLSVTHTQIFHYDDLPVIDINGFDRYYTSRNGRLGLFNEMNGWRSKGKPVEYAETGAGNIPMQKIVEQYYDVSFHNRLWSSAFMGSIGPGLYFYRSYVSDIGLKKARNTYRGLPDPIEPWKYYGNGDLPYGGESSSYNNNNFEVPHKPYERFWPFYYKIKDDFIISNGNKRIPSNDDPNQDDLTPDFTDHLKIINDFFNETIYINGIDLQESFLPQRYPYTEEEYKQSNWDLYDHQYELEAFSLVNSNGNNAIGWVHNRSNYWGNYEFIRAYDDYNFGGGGYDPLQNFVYQDSPTRKYRYFWYYDHISCNNGDMSYCNEDDDVSWVIQFDDPIGGYTPRPSFWVRFLQIGTYNIKWYETKGSSVTEITGNPCGCTTTAYSIGGAIQLFPPCLSDATGHDYAFIVTKQSTKSAMLENEEMESKSVSTQVKVLPNPNKGKFRVEISGVEETAQINVTNLLGSEVFTNEFTGSTCEIDLTNHPKGIYIVKTVVDKETFIEKVIYK